MPKTQDYTYEYRGYWSEGGVCRVRLYETDGLQPMFLVSELPENENTSITNLAEYLAAELRQKHMLGRYDTTEFIWVEHYPRSEEELRYRIMESWAFVTFSSYEIRQSRVFGPQTRPRIGCPDWSHITIDAVAAMVTEYGEVLEEACTARS